MQFQIIRQERDWLVIDKPEGFYVHPPESGVYKVPKSKIILHQLRDQIGQYVYPIHRLDVATSGILLFALTKEKAHELNELFLKQKMKKTYWAIVRGWPNPEEGEINLPLESDSTGELRESKTIYKTLHKIEWPDQVSPKYKAVRYSWLEVYPQTGRYRQIRRHMNRISHPILGDGDHGDSHHNRYFREQKGIHGVCLRCVGLSWEGADLSAPAGISLAAPINEKWLKIQGLFNT